MLKIVIVGGGAGGLELATKLGKKLGRRRKAQIVLIDKKQIHLWKPLLHEVASGTLDSEVDAVSYRAHAHNHHFLFKIGSLCDIDRSKKHIVLASESDAEGVEILPQRTESYDQLVLAIGSESNDFGTPGIRQHCMFLDSLDQAEKFQNRLLNQFIKLDQTLITYPDESLSIAIVGGGATGVELSAELVNARQWFSIYGLDHVRPEHLKLTLIEAGPRLLPALSERIADAVVKELEKLGLTIRANTQIISAADNLLITNQGEEIRADLMVWAAGIKAPEFLKDFGGLQTNKANQVLTRANLLSLDDDSIFVIGDCAGTKINDDEWVPPRAQSAHQMASLVYKNILNSIAGKALVDFKYSDYGSLVSLSHFSAVGRLMGNFSRGSLNIEGKLARLAYLSLYRMHQLALHGWIRMILIALSERINKVIRPRLKLH